MTLAKRLLDIVLALLFGALLLGPLVVLALVLLLSDGRPIFYVSERMRSPGESFWLVKLRTMRPDPTDSGVSGGDKARRIFPLGQWMRRTRADEIPQLWNILKGDMSFVGPRPPLRQYVKRFPDLYARVLQSRPGVTGLATLVYHGHEERLLLRCATRAQTDAVYARNCVPRKARIDLIYQRRRTVCLDLWLIWLTAVRLIHRRW